MHDLISLLRLDGPDRINYLLGVVRASDSLEEIGMAISANLRQESGSPPKPEIAGRLEEALPRAEEVSAMREHASGSDAQKRRNVMSIQSLADKPVYNLPAKPWTDVTDDDHFVSHLVSLYFMWEHAAYHVIDCEAFISDMQSGQLDAEACSPFLANAVLAAACVSDAIRSDAPTYSQQVFSDYPEAYAIPGQANSRGDHFFKEAKRLWEAEQGVNSLTNVQGLCMLYLRYDTPTS